LAAARLKPSALKNKTRMKIICQTERLRLREYTVNDTRLLLKTFNEPDFIKFVGDKHIRSHNDALKRLQEVEFQCYQRDGFGSWLLELKSSGKAIGSCGVFRRETGADVELGYALCSEFYGQGFGQEAAQAVVSWVKKHLDCDKIIATTSLDHLASIRLLQKIGFVFQKNTAIEGYDGLSKLFHYSIQKN
jgi:RimJ/RimL family protein N-acetyltransferase